MPTKKTADPTSRMPLTVTLPAYAITEITKALLAHLDDVRREFFDPMYQFDWPFMIGQGAAAEMSFRADLLSVWCAALEDPIAEFEDAQKTAGNTSATTAPGEE